MTLKELRTLAGHTQEEAKKAAKKKVKKRVDVFNSATHNEHSKTETLNEASGE